MLHRARRVALVAVPILVAMTASGCTGAPPQSTSGPGAARSASPSDVSEGSTSEGSTSSGSTDALPPVGHASIDDPASVSVVVNKTRALRPADHVPSDLVAPSLRHLNAPELRAEAAAALVPLFEAARGEGAGDLQIQSAYRSYDTQVRVYDGRVRELGQVEADLQSARPGTSEHQTGLAVDLSAYPAVCSLQACFASTPQGRWLAGNAHRFGFVLRYPEGRTAVTGYAFEPWHYRFVGVEAAADMRARGVTTLEQYQGLPAAPAY